MPTDSVGHTFRASFAAEFGKRLAAGAGNAVVMVWTVAIGVLAGSLSIYVGDSWAAAAIAASAIIVVTGAIVVTVSAALAWQHVRRTAPRFLVTCDKNAPTSDIVLSVRNEGGPAKVRAYARLVSVNLHRDANSPAKQEYLVPWIGTDQSIVLLGRGESAALLLAENAPASLEGLDARHWFLNFWTVKTSIDPFDEKPINSWTWGADDPTPIRVVVAVRLVGDPQPRTTYEAQFAIATRPPYGNIFVEGNAAANS